MTCLPSLLGPAYTQALALSGYRCSAEVGMVPPSCGCFTYVLQLCMHQNQAQGSFQGCAQVLLTSQPQAPDAFSIPEL